jgi:hypothetical protein
MGEVLVEKRFEETWPERPARVDRRLRIGRLLEFGIRVRTDSGRLRRSLRTFAGIVPARRSAPDIGRGSRCVGLGTSETWLEREPRVF